MLSKEALLLALGGTESGVLEIRAPRGFPDLTGGNRFYDEPGTKYPIDATATATTKILTGVFPFMFYQEKPTKFSVTLSVVENCTIRNRPTLHAYRWSIHPENPKKRSIIQFTYA